MVGAATKSLFAQLLTRQPAACHALLISRSSAVNIARNLGSAAAGGSGAASDFAAAQQQRGLSTVRHTSACNCSTCSPAALHSACVSGAATSRWQFSSSSCRAQLGYNVNPLGTKWASTRGFAAFTGAISHEACSHANHQGDHDSQVCGGNSDQLYAQIQATKDLQQLQSIVQQHSSSLDPRSVAAAFKHTLQLVAGQEPVSPGASEPVLQALTEPWIQQLHQATITDLSDCIFSCSKLNYRDPSLWSKSLAAVPKLCADGDGRDLANIAFALASMADQNAGEIPGVSKEEVQEVLRAVTHQVVSMVSGPGGTSDHSHGDGHDHGESGCGHQHHKSGKKSVTIGNISTVRWAHEVLESLA